MDLKRTKVQTASEEIHRSKRGKAVQTDNKIRASEPKDDLDIEEGQIVLEEPNVDKHLENKHSSESRAHFHNVKKRISLREFVSGDNKVAGKYDNQHILETMAKMEKRRERFKDTVTQKKELDNSSKPDLPRNNPKPEVALTVESTEIKQQRPIRKRRWSGF